MKRPKKKTGTVIFFPGWPEILGLLVNFFALLLGRYERVFIFNEKLGEEDLKKMSSPIIGISYSAGAISMINFVSKHAKIFDHIIFDSPAGTRKKTPWFFIHCLLFIWELIKLIKCKKWFEAKVILKEIISRILKHPVISLQEINKIRKFRLYEEMLIKIYSKVDFAFIFSAKDKFQFAELIYCIHGRFRIESKTCGHFGLIEKPEVHFNAYEEL
jgi:hypothetical protein